MFAKTWVWAATAAALASSALAQTIIINTPAVARQCENTLLTWEGGSGLYFLRVLEDGAPIQEFGGLPSTQHSLNWQTNVKAGTTVTLALNDETGATAETAPFTIQPGEDDCNVVG